VAGLLDFPGRGGDKRPPMTILVKICGINCTKSADAAIRAGADLGGLVFHPGSPRHLSFEAARALAERMRGRLRLVALVADAGDEYITQVLKTARPDYLQLHGKESPERVAAIQVRFGVKLIKAVAVAGAADLACVPSYVAATNMLLFDAKAPDGSARQGGHGAPFDWQLLRRRSFGRPWLLAGGLTPSNVARAVAAANAPGVDVSSGVETAPGAKSCDLIAAFVNAARNTQEAQA
jgi:phosphoribosylanthranilate isomerase